MSELHAAAPPGWAGFGWPRWRGCHGWDARGSIPAQPRDGKAKGRKELRCSGQLGDKKPLWGPAWLRDGDSGGWHRWHPWRGGQGTRLKCSFELPVAQTGDTNPSWSPRVHGLGLLELGEMLGALGKGGCHLLRLILVPQLCRTRVWGGWSSVSAPGAPA